MVFVDLVVGVKVESMDNEINVFVVRAVAWLLLVEWYWRKHKGTVTDLCPWVMRINWFFPHVKKQQPVIINTGLVDVIK